MGEKMNVNYIESPLIEIKSDSGFLLDLKYCKKYKNAIDKCYVRKEVYDKLLEAKKYLPDNLTFKIWDAYRPIELQKELYYSYKEDIISYFKLENMSDEQQNKIINKYVAYPGWDDFSFPAHTTGGAVDLTLVDINTLEELDMGCDFDSFDELTSTMAFEEKNMDINVRNNRRILYNAMIKAGFTNLESEYWHYDYGDINWAKKTNSNVLYSGIDLKKLSNA